MKKDNWKVIQLRRKLRYGAIMSVYMIPLQILLFATLMPPLLKGDPLSAQEAGIAAGCILLSFRLVQRIRRLYAVLQEAQDKQLAEWRSKKP